MRRFGAPRLNARTSRRVRRSTRWFRSSPQRTAFVQMTVFPDGGALPSFACLLPGRAEEIAHLRHTLRLWLSCSGVSSPDVSDIVLAVDEAVTNAIEHSNPGSEATVEVAASVHPDATVVVEIADEGSWRAPHRSPSGGRGIELMNLLCDSVEIEHGNGTVVRLSRRPHGPGRGHGSL
jgi:anti-sigma regulatory factor (Ser/Thr protein kinase)